MVFQCKCVNHSVEEGINHTTRLSSLRKNRVKLLCHLAFLSRCKRHNIYPQCTVIKTTLKCAGSAKIIRRARSILLNHLIRQVRRKLCYLEKKLYDLHLKYARYLHPAIWQTMDVISYQRSVNMKNAVKKKQVKKFHNLLSAEQDSSPSPLHLNSVISDSNINARLPSDILDSINNMNNSVNNNPIVVNLTDRTLDEKSVKLLDQGPKFAIPPYSSPIIQTISNVEDCIRHLSEEEKTLIRIKVKQILSENRTIPHKPSTFKTMQSLLHDNSIKATVADKGSAIVIMSTDDYNNKIETLINDPAYILLKRDPTSSITNKLKVLINNIDLPGCYKIPSNPRAPRLYGTCKLHKEGKPLRPVVSNINAPYHQTAKSVADLLKPLLQHNHSISNSSEAIQRLNTTTIEYSDILVSFDIKSLFTKVPTDEAINIIQERLGDSHYNTKQQYDILELVKFCTKNAYLQVNNKYYKQIEGTPMGSNLSPILCEIFMEHFEDVALKTAKQKPKLWVRYVDDTLVIWPHGANTIPDFLNHLNSINPNIEFTHEMETNNSLPFLDIYIFKTPNEILLSTYRKPTNTIRSIPKTSHHHTKHKISALQALVKRAYNICNNKTLLKLEIAQIKHIAKSNGYDPSIVDTLETAVQKQFKHDINFYTTLKAFTCNNKTQQWIKIPFQQHISTEIEKILKKYNIRTAHIPGPKNKHTICNRKDITPKQNKDGIYQVECECKLCYIGQTRRKISIRLQEHERDARLKKQQGSALSQHLIETKHTVKWDEVKIMAQPHTQTQRNIFEYKYIQESKPNLNLKGGYEPPEIYKTFISDQKYSHNKRCKDRPTPANINQ